MSVISLVKFHDHEGSPMGKEVNLRWEGFVKKVCFCLEWKSEQVMDDESGDDENVAYIGLQHEIGRTKTVVNL